jgi:Tol biopolymer transport system component/DNA-binding winged helix-turn-helix (wHTH) protein
VFRFGPFALDPERGELTKDGRLVRLPPQPTKLLVLLASRAGHVVTREEIQQELWTDATFVDYDQSINFCIKRIRDVLGDDSERPRFVETIPRRGYRFVAPVAAVEEHSNRRRLVVAAVAGAALLAAIARAPLRSAVDVAAPVTRPVTSFEGEEDDPAFSPDGRQIAFVWNGGKDAFTHVWTKMLAAGDPLQLTDGDAYDSSPAWSPDGSALAFLRTPKPPPANAGGLYDVLLVPALGGAERVVARTASARPAWHPDGEHLIIGGETVPARELHLLSLRTGERKPLTSIPEGEALFDRDPAFSPDGETLAFVRSAYRTGGSGDEIHLQPVKGGEAIRVSSRFRSIGGLDWTADGRALVFSAPFLAFRRDLWKLPIDGREPTRLGTEADPGYGLSVSEVGNRLAYTSFTWDDNIWKAAGPTADENGAPEKLIASTRRDEMAEYSPDGTRVVFVSDRSGDTSLWIADAEGKNSIELAGTSKAHLPRWSPSGDEIAYGARLEPDGAGVFVVSVRGGVPRHVTTGELRASFPSWSTDGKHICYQSWVNGDGEIRRIPAAGGASELVSDIGGTSFPEVRGDRLLYEKDGRLWSVPLDGSGEATLVLEERVVHWTLWRDKIVYPKRHSDREVTIELWDPETGDTRTVRSLGKPPVLQYGLDVSPDGRSILYSQRDDRKKDILIVENFDPEGI